MLLVSLKGVAGKSADITFNDQAIFLQKQSGGSSSWWCSPWTGARRNLWCWQYPWNRNRTKTQYTCRPQFLCNRPDAAYIWDSLSVYRTRYSCSWHSRPCVPYTISERYKNGYKNAERLFSFQERLFQFVIYFIRHWFQSLVAMVLLHILVVGEMLEPHIPLQQVLRPNTLNISRDLRLVCCAAIKAKNIVHYQKYSVGNLFV